MTKNNTLRLVIGGLIILLGLAILICGVMYGDSGNSVLASFGGTVSGVGIALMASNFLGTDLEDRIQWFFEEENLGSKISDTEYFLGPWCLYHASSKHGRKEWLYGAIDFQADKKPGTLKSKVSLLDQENKKASYKLKAGIRSNKFIVSFEPEKGSEPHCVMVIEDANIDQNKVAYGVQIHQTWDLHTAISPVLISKAPIVETENDGISLSEKAQNELERIWRDKVESPKILNLIEAEFIPSSSPSDNHNV
uniref:Uncharacterized protein n=1 Tax=Candidatus Kentrum sp. DK TaxID=2126562 RepID=A0A450T222_9GAMM|nr:MAG: hypothetical protein BECKDK2373B_GA0170837_109117 [Candidatus Kentron sp. DK]